MDLRSEKVKEILGRSPNKFIRWGVTIICIIYFFILVWVLCLEFPYSQGKTVFEHIFFSN